MKPSFSKLSLLLLWSLFVLSGCGIDKEAGLCTYMGACTEDPEEKKEKADKKWWCEYYSGKNCGDDASAASSSPKDSDAGVSAGHSASGQDDN